MLTPQDISEKGFVKAVFGGYDMEGVDEFLETVSSDYSSLYKENAILKGKLKVLVEKVEEYRSTEDAMRMALLTAQRMGEEITVEANRTKDEMLQKADSEIKTRLSDTAVRIADEEQRLKLASAETAKFIELSQAIMRKHSEFLEKLETARSAVTIQSTVAQNAPKQKAPKAPKPAPPPPPPIAPIPQEPPQPAPVPEPPDIVEDDVISGIAEQIGSAVEKITNADAIAPLDASETNALSSHIAENDGDMNVYRGDVQEEPISPRPKFDFDDLKFGANFDTDE